MEPFDPDHRDHQQRLRRHRACEAFHRRTSDRESVSAERRQEASSVQHGENERQCEHATLHEEEPPVARADQSGDVADVRDGALSGSTLKEASSWGKVDTTYEQMVYCEATIAVPLIVGYAYHKRGWEGRTSRKWSSSLDRDQV